MAQEGPAAAGGTGPAATGSSWWLAGPCLALLAFFIDDYIVAGLLPEVSAGLGVGEAAAGQLVTVFSLTMAVATPVAAVVFARTPRRRLLPAALGAFIAANAAMTLVDHYAAAVLLRVASAAAAAAAVPAIFAAVADLSPEQRRGRNLAVLSTAATVSIAVGVPCGTWLAARGGWHAAFAAMAALGAVALAVLALTLPAPPTQPATPLREQLAVLAGRRISLALLGAAVAIAGALTLVTYIAPYLEQTLGRADLRPALFAVFGICATAGTLLGGAVNDRIGPDRTIVTGLGAYILVLLGFAAAWWARPVGLPAFIPLVLAWGVFTHWSAPAIQVRLHQLAGPLATQALALNSSLGAVGVAAGAALGGLLLAIGPVGLLPVAGAVLAGIGLALLRAAFRGAPEPAAGG